MLSGRYPNNTPYVKNKRLKKTNVRAGCEEFQRAAGKGGRSGMTAPD
jgi:hypothetical protein